MIDSGAVVAFFNALSLIVVAWLQYKTKKDVTEVKHDTKDQTSKIEETKQAVHDVHQLANGRLNAALAQIELLKAENEHLKANLGHRRSTDTPE